MSTEDDALINLSDDDLKEVSDILDGDAQESPQKSDTISPETVQPEGETEEPKEEPAEAVLSPEVQVIIDKYSSLDEEEREIKLRKLESSGRAEQLKAAEIIREAFEIPREVVEETQPKTKEYTPEEQRLIEKGRVKEREEYISNWSKENNKSVDASKALTNDKFLKVYYSKELQALPLKERTELALFRTFDTKSYAKKSEVDVDTPVQGSGKPVVNRDNFDPFKMNSTMSVEDFLKN